MAFTIWRWVIEDAVLIGRLKAPGFGSNPWPYLALDIRPDAWKHLQPEQDINARNKAVSNNISNAEAEAAEYGRDLEDNMRRNAKALKRWEEICSEEGVKQPGNLAGLFRQDEAEKSGDAEE